MDNYQALLLQGIFLRHSKTIKVCLDPLTHGKNDAEHLSSVSNAALPGIGIDPTSQGFLVYILGWFSFYVQG